jgi:uncharacterized membrane protein
MNGITKSEYKILKKLEKTDLHLDDLMDKIKQSDKTAESFIAKLNQDKLIFVDMIPVARITALGVVSLEKYREDKINRVRELILYPLCIAILAAVISKFF